MKLQTVFMIISIALVCHGEGQHTKFDGLLGYKFGMTTPEWNERGHVDIPLKKPIKRFNDVTIEFNVRTKEVYGIELSGRYPKGTKFGTVKLDAEFIEKELKIKYGVIFVQPSNRINDQHIYARYLDHKDDVVGRLDVFKLGDDEYILELYVWNQTMRAKNELCRENPLAPPTIGRPFNVNDPRIRQVFKVSNIKRNPSVPGALSFEYVDPNARKKAEGCSVVEVAAVRDGIVFGTITSMRFTYATQDEIADAAIKAFRVWGTSVMMHKRLTVDGGTATEISKSAALAFVDAKGLKFDNESERAIMAVLAAKKNGLSPKIEVVITEIPGNHYVYSLSVMTTESYVSFEEMCTMR